MESGSKKRVLVTGASGMLGKALIKFLEGRYETLGISRRETSGGIACDLSDEAQVRSLLRSHPAALLIHTAAYSDVDGCERDPEQAHKSNVLAPKNLAAACAAARLPWIHVSTDYVFDGRKRSPYLENDPTGPVNIYGLTKWCGEYYAAHCGVSSAIVRTSWLFGPDNPANFVNAILGRLHKEKKVSVLDDQTDSPTSVKDLSAALLRIGERLIAEQAKNPATVWHDTFHVCNGGAATRLEMTAFIKEQLRLKEVTVEKADRSQVQGRLAIRPGYVVMSTKHYTDTFKDPLRHWHESLKEYVNESARCAS